MRCPKCGNDVPENAKFCPSCGKKFKKGKGCFGSCSTVLIIVILITGFLSWKNENIRAAVIQLPFRIIAGANRSSAKKETSKTSTPRPLTASLPESDDISADLKKFLDDYEVYWNDYIAYTGKYDRTDTAMVTNPQYISLLIRGAELEGQYETFDSQKNSMSGKNRQYFRDRMETINTIKSGL